MITESDLRAAIAECEGSRNPSASTCVKLAAYYTILNQKNGTDSAEPAPRYSYASEPDIVNYGDSEFSRLVKEKTLARSFPVIEELMKTLLVVDPKLYQSAMRKLRAV